MSPAGGRPRAVRPEDYRPHRFNLRAGTSWLTSTGERVETRRPKRMKTLGLTVCTLLGALSFASAQTESRPDPPPTLTATNRIQRIFGPTAVVDGVLPEVKRRGGVFTRADLDAPVVQGQEFRNLSIHPRTGTPQGVIFLAVRF